MTDAFISYSRKDISFAHQLHDEMQARGFEVWIDWKDIPASADWKAEIREAIEQADAFIVILSQASVGSATCSEEIAHAIENNKRLVPIVLGKINASSVHPTLAALNWILIDPDVALEEPFDILSDTLRTNLSWVKAHTHFQNLALVWQRHEEQKEYLLRGGELVQAEVWITQSSEKEPQPTALQNSFLLASRLAAARAQRNRLFSVITALLLTIALAITALLQRSQAVSAAEVRATAETIAIAESARRATAEMEASKEEEQALEQYAIATSRFLASQALLNIEPQHLDLALLLSVAASQISDTEEARASLEKALSFRPNLLKILHQSDKGYSTTYTVGDGLAFSPDGSMIASASQGHLVTLWDLETGARIGASLQGPQRAIEVLAFSPDGRLLAAGDNQSFVSVWEVATGELLVKFELPNIESRLRVISGLEFDPTSSFFVVSDMRGPFSVWKVQDFSLIRKWNHTYGRTWAISLSPDGRTLASVHETDRVVLWDIATGEQIGDPLSLNDSSRSIAFSPDGRFIYAAGGQVLKWETASGRPSPGPWDLFAGVSQLNLIVYQDPISGNEQLAIDKDHTLQVYDLDTHEWIGEPLRIDLSGQLARIVVSTDHKRLATNSGVGTVFLWDLDPQLLNSGTLHLSISLEELQVRACSIANRNLTDTEWQIYLTEEPYRKICPELP